MSKLTIKDGRLRVKSGLFSSTVVDLAAQRLVFLRMPTGGGFTILVYTTSSSSYVDLDSLSDDAFDLLGAQLAVAGQKGSSFGLSSIRFLFADYDGQRTTFTLADVKRSGLDLFGLLRAGKEQRVLKRSAWLASRPSVKLVGQFGRHAVADRDGYHRGKKITIPWQDVDTVSVEETVGNAHFYVLPKGVSSSMFNLTRGKYAIGIPKSKTEFYTAEVAFWRSLGQGTMSAG